MNLYDLIINENFAIYASIFIASLGILTLARYLLKIIPIYLNVKKMVKQLGRTAGEKGFREAYDELNEIFLNNKILCHSWYEFSEGLLVGKNTVRNTKRAIEYFSRETLLYGHLNLPFYQSMPNILTGMGILGTFLGLLCGVSQVDIQEISSIELLLHGASFSFYTSIAGLSASIVFTFSKKISLFFIDSQIQKWVEMLDHRLEWMSPEKIAFLALEKQDKQIHLFEDLADNIAGKLSDSLEIIYEKELGLLSQIMDNTAPEKLEPIKKQLAQNNSLISDSTETIYHKQDKQIQVFEGLADKLGVKLNDSLETIYEKELGLLSQIMDNTAPEKLEPIKKQLAQNNSLVSDGIETMYHKLENVKQEIIEQSSDNNKGLVDSIKHIELSFDEFKEKMIEENINSVVQALEVVINDFNSQVNEQFGENFKEYNEAIRRLLQWQENYKDHIDQLHAFLPDYYKNIESSAEKITVAASALEKMNQHAAELVKRISQLSMTSKDIDDTLTTLNRQNIEMESFIKSIKKIGDEASKSIPEIGKNIDRCAEGLSNSTDYLEGKISEMTEGLSNAQKVFSDNAAVMSKDVHTLVNKMSTEVKASADIMHKSTENTAKKMDHISQEYSKQIDKTTEQMGSSLEKLLKASLKSLSNAQKVFSTNASEMSKDVHALVNQMSSGVEASADIIQKATEDTAKKMEQVSQEHSKQIDKTTEQIESGLEKLLNESLKSLANSLIVLSRKFVDDYSPLTEKLQNVILIAESVDDGKKRKVAS